MNQILGHDNNQDALTAYCTRVYNETNSTYCTNLQVIHLDLLPYNAIHHDIANLIGSCRTPSQTVTFPLYGWEFANVQNLLYVNLSWSSSPAAAFSWVEVAHCEVDHFIYSTISYSQRGTWFTVARGSGVSLNVGRTLVLYEQNSQTRHSLYETILKLIDAKRSNTLLNIQPKETTITWQGGEIFIETLLRLDSIQIIGHHEDFSVHSRHELVMLDVDGELSTLAQLLEHTVLPLACGRSPLLFPCDVNMMSRWEHCRATSKALLNGRSSPRDASWLSPETAALMGLRNCSASIFERLSGLFWLHQRAATAGFYIIPCIAAIVHRRSHFIPAFIEHLRWRMGLLVSVSMISMSGVSLGFHSIVSLLSDNGNLPLFGCRTCGNDCCDNQPLVWMAASSFLILNCGVLVFAELERRCGIRFCFSVAVAVHVAGWIMVLIFSHFHVDDFLWIGYLLLNSSAPGIFVTYIVVFDGAMGLTPQSILFAAASCNFSAGLFFVLSELHFTVDLSLSMLIVCWMSFCICLSFLTYRSFPDVIGLHNVRVTSSASGFVVASGCKSIPQDAKLARWGIDPLFFVLLLLVTASLEIKSSFYLTTIHEQWRATFPKEIARELSNSFQLAFPLGSICFCVTPTKMLFKHKWKLMALAAGLNVTQSLLALSISPLLQYAGGLFFGPARTLLWAAYLHIIQNLQRHSRCNFVQFIGCSNLVIGTIASASTFFLSSFVFGGSRPIHDFSEAPALRLLVVNIACTGFMLAAAVVVPLCLWLLRSKSTKNNTLH